MKESQIVRKRSRNLFILTCVLGVCTLATGVLAINRQSLSDAVATIFLIATATLAFVEHRVLELKAEMLERFSPQEQFETSKTSKEQ